MWTKYNPNPAGRSVGDCSIRAIAKALNVDWKKAFALMAIVKAMNEKLYNGVIRKLSR